MPKQLSFFKFSERKPEHDRKIWYIANYSYGGYEFKYGTVHWQYLCLNKNGDWDGGSVGYSEEFSQPENTKISYFVDGYGITADFLWAYEADIQENLFEK